MTSARRVGLTSLVARLSVVALLASTLALTMAEDARAADEPESTESRPNADRPLTHEELLAIRGERTSFTVWGPATLVAETVIEREQPLRGGDEWFGEGPAFGAMPREDPHPGDPVVLAGKRVAASYPADDSPVSGLLAISDSRAYALQLQGTVETPAGTYLTPIKPGAMAAADALPIGALVIVRGWFSNLLSNEACPDVPEALDPNDAGGRDSSFVRCPGGWLTTDEVTEVHPDDPTIPVAFGVPVQSGVLEQFGRRTSDEETNGPANYLLRHVGNPVDGAEAALGWKVIGRVDPVSIPELDPPSGPDDMARPGGLDWQPGMVRQPPADGWSLYSTAWHGGFATVRVGRDRVMSSWVSSDGRSWESAELPIAISTVSALLRLRDGLVLIANELRFDEPWRYEVWVSDDGLEWRRISRQRVSKPERFDGYRRNVQGFWSLGGRVVALATYTTTPCCGSSSGWMVVAGRKQESDVTFAWTSRDGKDWTRHRTRGIPSDTQDWFGPLITQGEGELLALWGGADWTIGRTTDGIRWRTIGHLPKALDLYSLTLLVRTKDGLVLGGSVEVEDSSGWPEDWLTFWRSADGERWERTLARFDGRPASIASSGNTVIVAGNDHDPRYPDADPPPELPWLMVSEDGGWTWDATLAWVGDTEWCLESLMANRSNVSLDAACATPDAASTYAVQLPVEGPPS